MLLGMAAGAALGAVGVMAATQNQRHSSSRPFAFITDHGIRNAFHDLFRIEKWFHTRYLVFLWFLV